MLNYSWCKSIYKTLSLFLVGIFKKSLIKKLSVKCNWKNKFVCFFFFEWKKFLVKSIIFTGSEFCLETKSVVVASLRSASRLAFLCVCVWKKITCTQAVATPGRECVLVSSRSKDVVEIHTLGWASNLEVSYRLFFFYHFGISRRYLIRLPLD